MKILIVDDDSDIREILEFTFSCEVDSDYIHAETGNEAIEIIKNNEDLDLIVCDYNMPDGNGGDVYKFLLETNNPLPYVFCSSEHSIDHDEFNDTKNLLGEITKPYIYDGVQANVKAFNELNTDNQFYEQSLKYLPVTLDVLLKFEKLPCDLHVQLNNGKVLKILNKDDLFTAVEYNKYAGKGIEHLVIAKEEAHEFVHGVCSEIESILRDTNKPEENKVFDAHSVIMSTVSELGLSEKIVRATTASVDYALEMFSKNKEFKKLEKHIFGYPGKYLTTHSVALSYISVALLTKTSWDTPETRNKLVLAAFLHDATIRTPEFTELNYIDEAKFVNMKEHPADVQELLKGLKNIPPDLDRILMEHHERPDGSGFPRKLSGKQIHSLSSIFILAHDIVEMIFKLQLDGKEITEENIQSSLKVDDYSNGHFSKCYEAFLKVDIFQK